jgi:signal transduction histidine kinase
MHTLAALGEMAATVAHEIRNPLGGIAGFAALLERDLEKEDPRRRLVQKITEGVSRLNRIVTSLLSYTRPLNLRTHPVDLATMVEEVTAFFEIDLERHNHTISIHRHHAEEVVCPIDTEQFQQVILNLLQNATQAMPEGGDIRIQIDTYSSDQGTQGRLQICDSGIGMSTEVQERLFTPFFTTKEDGTGLGLVISKKIIDAHGGSIQVDSQQALTETSEIVPNPSVEDTSGTTFTIYLPL